MASAKLNFLYDHYKSELEKLVRSCEDSLNSEQKCAEIAQQNTEYVSGMSEALSELRIENTPGLSLQLLRLLDILCAHNPNRARQLKKDAPTALSELCFCLARTKKAQLERVCWHESGHVIIAYRNGFPSNAVIIDWHNDTFSWAGRRVGHSPFDQIGQQIFVGGLAAELYQARIAGKELTSPEIETALQRAKEDVKNFNYNTSSISDQSAFLAFAQKMSNSFSETEGIIMKKMVNFLIKHKHLGYSVLQAILNNTEPTNEDFENDKISLELETLTFPGYPPV